MSGTLTAQNSLAAPQPPHTISTHSELLQGLAEHLPGGPLSTIPAPSQLPVDGPTVEGGEEQSVAPVKRKPGRPKGSGKKPVDPNAPPKMKRPVGRPRKDGLPAGSVGPRKSSVRPRKRPPGRYAAPGAVAEPATGFDSWHSTQWPISAPVAIAPPASTSVPKPSFGSSSVVSEWMNLWRTNPNSLLQALVTSIASPTNLVTLGPSLEDVFASHLASLVPQPGTAHNGPPSLYNLLKTFWFPSSPSYFTLTTPSSTTRTPSEHRFLYWDPMPLVFTALQCPYCATPLTSRGRISSGPVKIHDLGRPFYVIGCEYVCKSPTCCAQVGVEGRSFSSIDQSILRSLPDRLRNEFPAVLVDREVAGEFGTGLNIWNWSALGVSKELWNMVRGCLLAGANKDSILEIISGIHDGVPDEAPPPVADKEEEEEEEEEETDGEQDEAGVEESGQAEQSNQHTHQVEIPSSTTWNGGESSTAIKVVSHTPVPSSQPPVAPVISTAPVPVAAVPEAYVQPTLPPNAAGPYPYPYPPFGFYAPHPGAFMAMPPGAQPMMATPGGLKRPFMYGEGTFEVNVHAGGGGLEPAPKRTRHCCKCGSQECKGKGGRSFCQNPCQDCGKLDCKGRNSKRPDKTCADAWA